MSRQQNPTAGVVLLLRCEGALFTNDSPRAKYQAHQPVPESLFRRAERAVWLPRLTRCFFAAEITEPRRLFNFLSSGEQEAAEHHKRYVGKING